MNHSHTHFLTSALDRLRLRKKQERALCPSCRGMNVERVNQVDDEEGYWKIEEYLCKDCDCEWDWTYQRPFFRWRVKIRPPKWMRMD